MDIFVLVAFTVFWFFRVYILWFHTDEAYEQALKRAKWMPAIFNQERYLVEDKQSWITLMKVVSIIMTALIVFVNILLLSSFLFGK